MSRSIYIPVFLFFMFGSLMSIGQSYVGILAGINNSRLAGDAPEIRNSDQGSQYTRQDYIDVLKNMK